MAPLAFFHPRAPCIAAAPIFSCSSCDMRRLRRTSRSFFTSRQGFSVQMRRSIAYAMRTETSAWYLLAVRGLSRHWSRRSITSCEVISATSRSRILATHSLTRRFVPGAPFDADLD